MILNMNIRRVILTGILTAMSFVLMAQEVVVSNPNIVYSENHPTYTLGGLAVSGITGFDNEVLLSVSELTVGQKIQVPSMETTEVIHRYWKQGLFSNVKLVADSIVGNKIYLHIHLTPQPRVSSISYSGVKTWNNASVCR